MTDDELDAKKDADERVLRGLVNNEPRVCEVDSTVVCDDCDGNPATCLVRVSEDVGLYFDRPETG